MERRRKSQSDISETRALNENSHSSNVHSSTTDHMHLVDTKLLKNDKISIAILLFLYVLQGVPLGLASSIPMILQNRKISYKDQAVFSFVNWPFSVKLLWAPAVDSLYSKRLGRRKTWLIPTQYFIGFFMLSLSTSVNSFLGDETSPPRISMLTASFFVMNFLAATQDIAVDGWALTMLSRQNVGYASVCNTVGQTTGFFLGNVVFLALESADFCNKYLRSVPIDEGLVTLSGFLQIWGIVFLVSTTLVLIFKSENEDKSSEYLGIRETYNQLYRIFRLRNMWLMVSFLLTSKIAFAATDSVTGLKLIEAGVRKENLALLAVPMVPLQILLPLAISRYTNGPKPFSVYLKAYPFRLACGLVFALLVWWTHQVKLDDGSFPPYYYFVIVIGYALQQVALYSMFVASMSFFAQVSDPAIGGTYMTLLNTICNFGGNWPSTLALWLVDPLTSKACSNPLFGCDTVEMSLQCTGAGHKCLILRDGYYVETIFCFVLGFLWLRWGKRTALTMQNLPLSAWKVPKRLAGSDQDWTKAVIRA